MKSITNPIVNVIISLFMAVYFNTTMFNSPSASLGFYFYYPIYLIIHISILLIRMNYSKKQKEKQYVYSLLLVFFLGVIGFCFHLLFGNPPSWW